MKASSLISLQPTSVYDILLAFIKQFDKIFFFFYLNKVYIIKHDVGE